MLQLAPGIGDVPLAPRPGLSSFLGMVASVVLLCGTAGAADYAEDEIKAALVLNLALYTEWPHEDEEGALDVCLVGFPRPETFERVLHRQVIRDRPVDVRPVKPAGDLRDCRVVFVRSVGDGPRSAILERSRELSILAIGEDEDFLAQGGHVALLREDDRVRFDVNLASLEEARIRLSSRVIRLARNRIRGSPGEGGG